MAAPLEGPGLAREYYRAIDAGDYDALADVLAPEFVQYRPDRTIRGREQFVAFMRNDRPDHETVHAVSAIYSTTSASDRGVAVEGQLLRASGEAWFGFVDVFDIDGGRFVALRTYTD